MSSNFISPLVLLYAFALTLSASCRAKVITLPNGIRAEGVTHARGTNFFVSNLFSDTVLLVDVASGLITTAVQPSGAPSQGVGMYNTAPGRLFVAGAGTLPTFPPSNRTDLARVYDVPSGRLIASCYPPRAGLVNDVVADRRFAYFTDSTRARIYRMTIAKLPRCAISNIDLDSRFFRGEGVNANGLVVYRGGLLVANSARSALFFVDLKRNNRVTRVVPDGTLPGIDGLAIVRKRNGGRLYVTQNARDMVSVWRLRFNKKARKVSVKLIRRIKRPSFNGPTTVALGGGYLVAANLDLRSGFNATGPFTLTATKIRA